MNTGDFLKFYSEEMGWRLFPCDRLKHPMVKWKDAATKELNMLNGWLDMWPDMNVGIATGSQSNLLAVDVDVKNGGDKTLAELFKAHGEFPETPISQTGTGGWHYLFQYPDVDLGNSAGRLGVGIDTRGEGGYIMAPPSIHENGNRYVWKSPPSRTALAMPPGWLIDTLYKQKEIAPTITDETMFGMGERNSMLASLAGTMRRRGLSEEAIFLALNVENLNKCNPPLLEDEVRLIAKSVARYEPTTPPTPKFKASEPLRVNERAGHISLAWDEFENEVQERAKDPREVWGIPYAFPYLSLLTGGKQKGELIICAGEPKIGKSYFWLQDALATAMNGTPVLYWSGEMRRKQVVRRLASLLGVDARRSRTGHMAQDDWDLLADAKAMLYNIPLYLDDRPMNLHDLRPLLEAKSGEFGISQFVIDYSAKVFAPGRDEIEKSANISNELKSIVTDLDLSGVLITSVNKMGMDSNSSTMTKSNVRGSGQQIHDADIVYLLTKYKQTDAPGELEAIKPIDYDRTVSLHISAGRELDHRLPGGVLHYMRQGNTPKFKEMKDAEQTPKWMERKDID